MSQRESDVTRASKVADVDGALVNRCADACFTCAQACLAWVEPRIAAASADEPTEIVRNGLGCADLCEATGMLLMRYPAADLNLVRAFLDTCAAGCRAWADGCDTQADPDELSRECREACLLCEQACRELSAAL
jgi:citrate lyase beta subunit